ncbi:hypothetical protein BJ912DRAFT_950998 [Pholiota molesta]|nr:hypothetical protein BJ912DRAFT_950998 [Pholiota molesta]
MPDRDYDDSGHHLFESIISSPQHSTELTCESLGRVGPVFLVVHLLDSLTPRNLVNRAPIRPQSPELAATVSKTGPRACAICQGIVFLDVDEQRLISALTWFHSPPSTQLGIYRSILPLRTTPDAYLQELRKLQEPVDEGRTWALFMIAGGHFAGAVVRKQKKPKPETEVVLHKTFHRYTTRRKQGGSQSANDNAKGAAKSAGAQLRRYGEQALRDDIRGLLEEWREDLADCERIWIRANTSNRRIFYDYEGAPWTKDDERLRTFPFPTRRPPIKLSKEEEILREKWTRLLEMVHKNRLEPLKTFLEREKAALGGIDAQIPDGLRTRSIRDIFRRCAATYPDWWDWLGAGRVPSALSQRWRRNARRRRRRCWFDPEMRAKVERERRARAAEARMKALGGG